MGEEQSYLGRANRYQLIGRLKKLARMGLAREEEPTRWSLTSGMEKTLRELGERGDIIKTMHRAIMERGLARGADDYVIHAGRAEQKPTVGRVIGKGLAGDELTGRLHLVIDGADGRVHYVELSEAVAGETRTGSIVEVGRPEAASRPADRNIAELARENGGVYEPAIHLLTARDTMRWLLRALMSKPMCAGWRRYAEAASSSASTPTAGASPTTSRTARGTTTPGAPGSSARECCRSSTSTPR